MAYRIDENGIPIISREDIEQKAEEFILHFAPNALDKPQMTPIATIMVKLKELYKTEFLFEEDLGKTKSGNQIIGKFRVEPRSIYVDKSLDYNSPRWLFTVAHEMGHLVFHRKLLKPRDGEENVEVDDSDDEVTPDDILPQSFYEWTEWQANKFASSLLMPKETFQKVVASRIEALGLVRNRGRIFLDNQPGNRQLLEQVLMTVCGIYQTSKEATIIRMKEFGFIIDVRQKSMRHISELLRED